MSRPSKRQAAPAPLYLLDPSTRYCHVCGRHIGPRKSASAAKAGAGAAPVEVKFCSERCRRRKKRDALDARIEAALLKLLQGAEAVGGVGKAAGPERPDARRWPPRRKGDPRALVRISDIERAVFGAGDEDGSEVGGGEGVTISPDSDGEAADGVSVYPDDGMGEDAGVPLSPVPRAPEVPRALPGAQLDSRQRGQKRADEREQIKQAARRAIVFGLPIASDEGSLESGFVLRKCEALINGEVVEPSFAKGDWTIRWRDA